MPGGGKEDGEEAEGAPPPSNMPPSERKGRLASLEIDGYMPEGWNSRYLMTAVRMSKLYHFS